MQLSEGATGLFALKEPARAFARRLLRLYARDRGIRWPVRGPPSTQRLRDARSPKAETPIAIHRRESPGGSLLRGLQSLFDSG